MQMFKWTGEAEDFLKKFQRELTQKKLAIFVSSMKSVFEREDKKDELAKAWKNDLDDKVAKYNLNPVSMALFGGVVDYNKMNIITRKAFGSFKKVMEADGFKEDPPGVYDMRDWEEIRKWAKDLAKIAR
jgi:menaquinone-dependent protoporphyrinogen IX oxidase